MYLTDNGRLRRLIRDVGRFRAGNERALNRATQEATIRSRATFQSRLSNRPHAPRREGRPTTGGNFAKIIRWDRERRADGTYVAFQLGELEARAPYWLIQEIGTGESATILDLGVGRSVKSQRGRLISPTLTWADAQGNFDVARNGVRNQQLMSLRDVKNVPLRPDFEQLRIKQEIEGKHYIREGGRHANAQYRASLLELARRMFA